MSVTAEPAPKLLTAEEVADRPGRWELVRGEVREMSPPGFEHGVLTSNLAAALTWHVRANRLGIVLAGDPGFLIARSPDIIRAPDVAFIAAERVPLPLPRGWSTIMPDLVVEVVSPSDTVGEVEEKIADWLHAGVRLVWVVYAGSHSVHVYRSAKEVRVLTEADMLEGEDVVPGFSLPVQEIFSV